jgi:hypothetical protein
VFPEPPIAIADDDDDCAAAAADQFTLSSAVRTVSLKARRKNPKASVAGRTTRQQPPRVPKEEGRFHKDGQLRSIPSLLGLFTARVRYKESKDNHDSNP